jgi:RHS repeat-associated protein
MKKTKNKIKIIAIFLALLVISLPIALAEELNPKYDGVGNLISGDGLVRTYDGFNNLVRIQNDSGNVLQDLIWHPSQERVFIKKIYNSSGDVAQRIVYVNENTVKIKNSSGTFYEHQIWQDGVLVSRIDTGGNKFAVHNDHLRSVSLLTDSSGITVEENFFSPCGEPIEGGKETRFDYTGKEYDENTKEYDFNARMYKPEWCRFVKPDVLIQFKYDPQALNKYSYVGNNPYKFVDPTGKRHKSPGSSTIPSSSSTSVETTAVYKVFIDEFGAPYRDVAYYDVTYKGRRGTGGNVRLTINAYQALQSQAYQQSQTAYSRYFSLGRNMQQEYFVSYLETIQGRFYEPRSFLQRTVQNRGFQLGATILGGIAGNVPGAAAVGGIFGLGSLDEKRGAGEDIGISDLAEVGADIAIAGAGGKVLKYSLSKSIGIDATENIIIDIASEVGANVIYDSTKTYVVD